MAYAHINKLSNECNLLHASNPWLVPNDANAFQDIKND